MGVRCAQLHITSEHALAAAVNDRSAAPVSDRVRAWVWELDLLPARKLVMLWLAGRATDNGVAFPGEREIRDRTGLGERMVRYHLHGLTADELDGPDRNPGPLLLRIERPIRAGRNTSNVYVLRVPWGEPAAVRRDLEELKHIPEAALNEVLVKVGLGATGCPHVDGSDCNGLPPVGGEVTAVTAAIRRRDLVIASDLVAAGATPSEAEAYAVETSAISARVAPVDLRSFERERLGWLARRRNCRRESRGFVDRSGQPPSWQTDAPMITALGGPEATGDELTETIAPPELAGSQLGRVFVRLCSEAADCGDDQYDSHIERHRSIAASG
jgi:hypothetical protein